MTIASHQSSDSAAFPGTASPSPEAEIQRLLRSIRFGTINVQIHDGRVVQVERSERIRFDQPRGR